MLAEFRYGMIVNSGVKGVYLLLLFKDSIRELLAYTEEELDAASYGDQAYLGQRLAKHAEMMLWIDAEAASQLTLTGMREAFSFSEAQVMAVRQMAVLENAAAAAESEFRLPLAANDLDA